MYVILFGAGVCVGVCLLRYLNYTNPKLAQFIMGSSKFDIKQDKQESRTTKHKIPHPKKPKQEKEEEQSGYSSDTEEEDEGHRKISE